MMMTTTMVIVTIMMMIIIMIAKIKITLKDAIQFFYTIFTTLRAVSNTVLKWPGLDSAQMMWNTSTTYHVQHILCHVVRRDASAVKFGRV